MVKCRLYEARVTLELSIAAVSLEELREDMRELANGIADTVEDSAHDYVHSILLADVLPGSVLLQESEPPNEGRIRLVPVVDDEDESE